MRFFDYMNGPLSEWAEVKAQIVGLLDNAPKETAEKFLLCAELAADIDIRHYHWPDIHQRKGNHYTTFSSCMIIPVCLHSSFPAVIIERQVDLTINRSIDDLSKSFIAVEDVLASLVSSISQCRRDIRSAYSLMGWLLAFKSVLVAAIRMNTSGPIAVIVSNVG